MTYCPNTRSAHPPSLDWRSTASMTPAPSSVPELLRIDPEDGVRKHVRVRQHVRFGVVLRALEPVEDPEELRLDKVDEDEGDRVRVRDARGGGRADEVGRGEERLLEGIASREAECGGE